MNENHDPVLGIEGGTRMARRRKTSSGAVIVLAVIGFISSRIGGVGCVLLAVGGAVALWWLLSGNDEEPSKEPKLERQKGRRKLGSSLGGVTISMNVSSDDELVTVRMPERQDSEYKLPAAPSGYGKARWIGPGESIEVAGLRLPGGLFYVGTELRAPNGETDPCLIDPTKRVASSGDYKTRQTPYWSGYATISPEARRAYLSWLADGRRDPHADLGFVFLFFYGLERRVLVEGISPEAQHDVPSIALEVRRLLQIYGPASNSFRMYGGGFLSWLELMNLPPKLYSRPVPELPGSIGVSFYLRVALGQAARDRSPLSPALALAWLKAEPSTRLRTAAKRCPAEFEKLFEEKYRASFGPGFVIPANRTRLKFVYRPASSGLRTGEAASTIGDLPDVTAVAGPIKKLQDLADETTAALEPYSRLIGRQPDAAFSLDGISLLPREIWPESALGAVRALRAKMGDGRVRLDCAELMKSFGANTVPTRGKFAAFAQALEGQGLGLEPDILARAPVPTSGDGVVLFELAAGEPPRTQNAPYLVAELTLQLASAVAVSDGTFGPAEVSHLREQIERWQHLTLNQRRRLHAQLSLLERQPGSTTGMKKKVERLDAAARETIAAIVVGLAQSDGQVSPEEVRALEKAYKVLGVDVKRLFSDLHGASTRTSGTQPTSVSPTSGFQLDHARVTQLQKDTERVSAMLSDIFAEPEVADAPAEPIDVPEMEAPATDRILGLDGPSSAFVRLVISRPQWTRSDLQDAASDMELMLDGALERMNEASLEQFDLPLLEGDDPVEVNVEVVERLSA